MGEKNGLGHGQDDGDRAVDFASKEVRVFAGSGGVRGTGRSGETGDGDSHRMPRGRYLDVVCAVCGLVEEDVPLGMIRVTRLQHEEAAHPDVFRLRQDLEALDRKLWPRRD